MSTYADLHTHTFFSDGTQSPQEVVQEAAAKGLCCVSITDHDSLEAIVPALAAAKAAGIECLPGIELSSEYEGKEIHVLGYGFDFQQKELRGYLEDVRELRRQRMKAMVQRLHDLGISSIEWSDIKTERPSTSLGRPHLAAVLVQKGIVKNMTQAFDQYLAEGAPAYVSKPKFSPFAAIDLIKKAGGAAVLAHPMLNQKDEIIPRLVGHGLDGLEVYYPGCSHSIRQHYEGLAKKHKLLMTGGSDAHGDMKPHTFVGKVKIPYTLVEELKARLQK